ncbi:MAG: phosphotransferase [Acidimicrobiales bacterium]
MTEVLEPRLSGACVTDVEVTPVGTGQMAEALRLSLTYDRPVAAPAALVAKMHAGNGTSRATGVALRVYEVEVRFYQELAAGLPMRTPACHFADVDTVRGAFVLLLEDMSPACQGDQLAGCSLQEAQLALDELALLHSSHWNDPGLAELEWLHRDPAGARDFLKAVLPGFWQGFVERYSERIGDEVRQIGDALVANTDAVLAPSSDPLTVVHGDYRLDNLLFGGPGAAAPIAVVDWQLVAHGSAMQDVAYFVGASFSPGDRRAVEDALVRRYYDRLLADGVAGYTWEDCWLAYRRASWAGLITAIAAANLVERTDRGDYMFLAMAHRHSAHVLDLEAPALLGG